MNNTAIIVTGLPASGKSPVASALATSLNVEIFDKDNFLEHLYGTNDVTDWDARKRLSRRSDIDFQTAASRASAAVLVSHWRPRKRHPGHMGAQRDPKQLAQNMLSMARGYPLGVGPVVEVSTKADVNIQNVLMQIALHCQNLK